jgi:diguanylate cyclase (GGDEF)-like protein
MAACVAALPAAGVLLCLSASAFGERTRLLLLAVYLPLGTACVWALARFVEMTRERERMLMARLEEERAAVRNVCLTSIESLAYAVEARTSTNLGHLARVQSYAVATARATCVGDDVLDAIRVAALVHDIGRLGVPDSILGKQEALTSEVREKLRAYPVLGGRLLAAIPFPWPVIPIVLHHREHFDGSGYPDGLRGDAIPLGARILAVADAYDTLVSPRGQHPGLSHEEAMAEIARVEGTQFDPAITAAFRTVVDETRERLTREEESASERGAAYEIARAQREVQALYEMACSVGATLCLQDTLEIVARKVRAIVPCDTCVVFLSEGEGEWLRAHAAYGINHWHFRRSRARMGAYLTGRAAWRGEGISAAYLPGDVKLRRTAEPWTPLRSTLIAPLAADGEVIGTINLYHTQSDAFRPDDLRVMLFIGELAGQAVKNARLFSETQETVYTDAVTELRNRRYLHHYLGQELNRARKTGHPLAVLGLDLDGFKKVNDTLGHEAGDEVLREIGQVFLDYVRNYDLVVRLAGDEFVIVLPETRREQARLVAEKMRAAVEGYVQERRQYDAEFPMMGVSVGAAVFPEDAEDMEQLLVCADRTMYADKRARYAAHNAA